MCCELLCLLGLFAPRFLNILSFKLVSQNLLAPEHKCFPLVKFFVIIMLVKLLLWGEEFVGCTTFHDYLSISKNINGFLGIV